MKQIHFIFIITLLFSTPIHAALIISPYAADLPSSHYSQSSYWPGLTAQNAFNGGQWNAGGYGTHWIQADMGESQTLSEIIITIQQVPNGYSSHQVYLSDSYIGGNYSHLVPIYSHSGHTWNGQVIDILLDTPQTGRYLEIVSNGGQSWTALGNSSQRIDWEDPIESQISAPNHLLLLGLGLLGLLVLSNPRIKKG